MIVQDVAIVRWGNFTAIWHGYLQSLQRGYRGDRQRQLGGGFLIGAFRVLYGFGNTISNCSYGLVLVAIDKQLNSIMVLHRSRFPTLQRL
jgi:hypothetical protein